MGTELVNKETGEIKKAEPTFADPAFLHFSIQFYLSKNPTKNNGLPDFHANWS